MYQSTLVIILFRLFVGAFLVGTVWLLVRLIKGYKLTAHDEDSLSLDSRATQPLGKGSGKLRFFIKSGIAFGLWFLFSAYLFAVDLFASVGDRFGEEPTMTLDTRTLGLIGAHILWFFAGLLLIYWVGRAPRKPRRLP